MAALQKFTESQDIKQELTSFKHHLKELPCRMQMFSHSMRSLYAEEALGSNNDVAVRFRQLRDDIGKDGMVYLQNILPVTTNVVSSIKDYFKNYEDLTFKEWEDNLEDIIKETKSHKNYCEVLLHMHEDILKSLKTKEDRAKILLTESKELVTEFQKKKEELENTANYKKSWAIGLAFVPFVNMIATPILATQSEGDMAGAVAAGAQARTQEADAIVVSKHLMPALKYMIAGLNGAAGFFSVVANNLHSLKGRASTALENPRKRHYKIMKNNAGDIKTLCSAYFAMLPDVRAGFAAIPISQTEQNCVKKWLEKEMERIKIERSSAVLQYFSKVYQRR